MRPVIPLATPVHPEPAKVISLYTATGISTLMYYRAFFQNCRKLTEARAMGLKMIGDAEKFKQDACRFCEAEHRRRAPLSWHLGIQVGSRHHHRQFV